MCDLRRARQVSLRFPSGQSGSGPWVLGGFCTQNPGTLCLQSLDKQPPKRAWPAPHSQWLLCPGCSLRLSSLTRASSSRLPTQPLVPGLRAAGSGSKRRAFNLFPGQRPLHPKDTASQAGGPEIAMCVRRPGHPSPPASVPDAALWGHDEPTSDGPQRAHCPHTEGLCPPRVAPGRKREACAAPGSLVSSLVPTQ